MEGTDRCTLSRLDSGWMLVGQAIWHDDGTDNLLSYDVRCAPDWQSLSADVAGEVDGRSIALKLLKTDHGWTLNGVLQPCGADCIDLDLSFTPATNLLPLRRCDLGPAKKARVRAAWLTPKLGSVEPLSQMYTGISSDRVQYSSATFEAELTVHPSGFVTHYPDIWDGWVDA